MTEKIEDWLNKVHEGDAASTAVVAENLGRDWIGIDLNKDYVEMSYDRMRRETDSKEVYDYSKEGVTDL